MLNCATALSNERPKHGNQILEALESLAASVAVLVSLGIAAAFCTLRNNWLARSSSAELRFEEIPPGQLITLDLT